MSDPHATQDRAADAMFLDGSRVTPGTSNCKCSGGCSFPCWQRIGLAKPCEACQCGPFAVTVEVPA